MFEEGLFRCYIFLRYLAYLATHRLVSWTMLPAPLTQWKKHPDTWSWVLPPPSMTLSQRHHTWTGTRTCHDIAYMMWPDTTIYRIRMLTPTGPSVAGNIEILAVLSRGDDNDESPSVVTAQVLQYMGPMLDWHRQLYTPRILGFRNLHFRYYDGWLDDYHGMRVAEDEPLLPASEWQPTED